MMTRLVAAAAMATLAAVAAVPIAANAATVVFSDSTFPRGSYVRAFVEKSDNNNAIYTTQCQKCGVGGGTAERIDFNFRDATRNVTNLIGLINPAFSYDPLTMGTISTVTSSVDKDFIVKTNQLYGNAFRTLIEQNGKFYQAATFLANVQGPADTGYLAFGPTTYSASDFALINTATGTFDTSSHPDFSGSTLQFGFAQLLGTSGQTGPQASIFYDNLKISIESATQPALRALDMAAAVPEPASWAMMVGGFALIGATMRRKQALSPA